MSPYEQMKNVVKSLMLYIIRWEMSTGQIMMMVEVVTVKLYKTEYQLIVREIVSISPDLILLYSIR